MSVDGRGKRFHRVSAMLCALRLMIKMIVLPAEEVKTVRRGLTSNGFPSFVRGMSVLSS